MSNLYGYILFLQHGEKLRTLSRLVATVKMEDRE